MREFPLVALCGVADYEQFGKPVTICALFAPNEGLRFLTLHTLSFLLMGYLH